MQRSLSLLCKSKPICDNIKKIITPTDNKINFTQQPHCYKDPFKHVDTTSNTLSNNSYTFFDIIYSIYSFIKAFK